jgi:hypothetical protein
MKPRILSKCSYISSHVKAAWIPPYRFGFVFYPNQLGEPHSSLLLNDHCMIFTLLWRTQEFFSGGGVYTRIFFGGVTPGIFFGGEGFNKFSWGQRAERMGIWGR